jgi:hypothetical protein
MWTSPSSPPSPKFVFSVHRICIGNTGAGGSVGIGGRLYVRVGVIISDFVTEGRTVCAGDFVGAMIVQLNVTSFETVPIESIAKRVKV